MQILGIEVRTELLSRWLDWLMPAEQPFVVPHELATQLKRPDDRDRLTMELKDAFLLYSLDDERAVVWLDEDEASQLPPAVRRAQPTVHRWPSDPLERRTSLLVEFLEDGRRPSRHAEVSDGVWRDAEGLLPGARALAGRFPEHSGPNCFGTVMAAAGVRGTADIWMQREPFEAWLADNARPGGADADPGTLLVWRSPDGAAQHAAVTIGGGWALHKPSQGWMSPTKVLTVDGAKASARAVGRRLHRHTLT